MRIFDLTAWMVAGASLLLNGARADEIPPRHRILVADDSTHRLAIVAPDGRLEWEVKVDAIHDAQVLPNGNVLLQLGWMKLVELSPAKEVVWEYAAALRNGNEGRRVEVHSFQRLENGTTMIAESGPARIIEVDQEGKLVHEVKLKTNHPSTHSDTRLARKLPNGNYLVAQEADACVREYDPQGTIVWEYEVPLFGQERKGGHGPEAFGNSVFSATRLANGNTILTSRGKQGTGPQLIEVTRDKKIVWVLHDWKNLGDATAVQILDDPGFPEVPGQSEH
jgi:hypothetical protein